MKEYSVKRNNKTFKVIVNDNVTSQFESAKGMKIAEITMDYKKHSIYYGGQDEVTKSHIFIIDGKEMIFADGDDRGIKELSLEAFAKHYKKNLYFLQSDAGIILYEACNDMGEKKELYQSLGFKITQIYKHEKVRSLKK